MNQWKPVEGFSGYFVSSEGSVLGPRKMLRPKISKWGYPVVRLCRGKLVSKTKFVHTLVARAFIGEIRPGYCVNHINGIKTDNQAVNLEIVTPKENRHHADQLGLIKYQRGDAHWSRRMPERRSRGAKHSAAMQGKTPRGSMPERKGSRNACSKLTEDQVIEIRRRWAARAMSQTDMGKEFGVSQPVISAIVLRKNWQHI